ncbi:hypothetical protein N7455_007207 [Penicillium solitum]|uniref:uncharacterized protein n=1 Tax=Penicillium solitum TaxID=60172 RepID=UPI0032C486D1|nr:hypothetical protein N7455_007207 [Penicillium solitum]
MWEIIGQEILIAHESDHIPVRLVLQACFSNVLPVSMPDYRVPSRSCLNRLIYLDKPGWKSREASCEAKDSRIPPI